MNQQFRRSSYSSGGQNCVEVALSLDVRNIAIRDSKIPSGPILRFSPAAYVAFAQDITACPDRTTSMR
ncbi:DUF397 domain-containing protein [Streptomyces luteireticuli]|uniref:DUF397 domain-containing protein n=1 Tax=Streptomyces luteireticuli TaxID=173858 RepID=UPI00355790A6